MGQGVIGVQIQRLLIGVRGLGGAMLLKKRETKIAPGFGQGRIDFQGLAIGRDGHVRLAAFQVSLCQDVVGLRVARLNGDGSAGMIQGFVEFSLPQKNEGQVVFSFGIGGADCEGLAGAFEGFVQLATVNKSAAEIIKCDKTVGVLAQSFPPNGLAVLIEVRVAPRCNGAECKKQRAAHDCGLFGNEFVDGPHNHDADADGGKVSVSVGHRLRADLHQADGRREHSEKPRPTDRQIWLLSEPPKRQTGEENQQQ